MGKNGSVRSCRKVELALGGAIESRELCEAGEALGWIGKGAIEAKLELDEPLPVGAPVAKKRSVIAGEKGTSLSTSPAAAPLCHGRGHALRRGETAVHESANADRRSAAHRHEQGRAYPPCPQNTLSEIMKLL